MATDDFGRRSERLRRPGGTGGGLSSFLLGLAMAVAGGYLFINRVTVLTSPWELWGINGYSLALAPFLFGVFFLFFNGKSIIGWLLSFAGLVIIFAGIIGNLRFFFRPTSLFATLVMLVLLFGGLGLVVRSLREFSRDD